MKYKCATILFACAVIAISIFATLHPSYTLGLFFELDPGYAKIRALWALFMLAYVLIPVLRVKLFRATMLMCGVTLLGIGICTILSPMLFGYLAHYTRLGDSVMAVEAGILSLLGGLQLKAYSFRLPKSQLRSAKYVTKFLAPEHSDFMPSQQL